jgi:hypothetical protein
VSREVATPQIQGEQRRAAGARRVRHIRRVIDGRGQRLSAPRPSSFPPLPFRGQRVVDLDRRMLVQRVMGSGPEEKHAEGQPRIDRDCSWSVGGSNDDGVAVVVEKRRTGRVAPVVPILRPGQRLPELPKGRDEWLRGTANSRLRGTLPEPADGKTLRRGMAARLVARRVDRAREPGELAERGCGAFVTGGRGGQRALQSDQKSTQDAPPLRRIRMRYALAHARSPPRS